MQKNFLLWLCAFLVVTVLIIPFITRAGKGSRTIDDTVSLSLLAIPSTLSDTLTHVIDPLTVKLSGNGSVGGEMLEMMTPCTDPNGAGTLRYCNQIFNQSEIVITKGIKYSTIAGIDLVFDLYTPPLSDTVTDRPLEIYLHGGGGETSDGGSACSQAARSGYVCISGDYRSGAGGGFNILEQKHAISDLDALIRYARLHAHEYGIDPNKLLLAGTSAGGMTALQSSITGNNQGDQSWFSSSDTLVNRANPTYPDGSPVPVWSCMAKSNSGPPSPPANNLIDVNDPPIALFLGGQDTNHGWTCETGQTVVNLMNGLNIPSYFQCFPNSDHGLGEGPAIDAVTIPMAYKELITESCPQSYSNLVKISTGGGGGGTGGGSTGGSGGGGSGGGDSGSIGGGDTTSNTPEIPSTPENATSESESRESAPVECPLIKERMYIGKATNPVEVKKLQIFLNEHEDENLTVDGVYGASVINAVARFEAKYTKNIPHLPGVNLGPGNVGWLVQAEINTLACMPAPLSCPLFKEFNSTSRNSNTSEVILAEHLLQSLGFYDGPLDGIFSKAFKDSLVKFQTTFHSFLLDPGGYVPGAKYALTNKFFNKLLGCETSPVRIGSKWFNY